MTASEVALALQPRDPSPELVEAEKWLRHNPCPDGECHGCQMARVITAELDRLRATVARQAEALAAREGEAQRECGKHEAFCRNCGERSHASNVSCPSCGSDNLRVLVVSRRCEEPRKP